MTHIFGFDTLKLPFESTEWRDADDRIFEACFAILRQYVEEELGAPEDGDSSHNGFRLHAADIEEGDIGGMAARKSPDRDAIDLWLWYRDELPEIEKDYDAEVTRCYGGRDTMTFRPTGDPELREVIVTPRGEMKYPYDYPEIIKDEKLRELIELRRYLWT